MKSGDTQEPSREHFVYPDPCAQGVPGGRDKWSLGICLLPAPSSPTSHEGLLIRARGTREYGRRFLGHKARASPKLRHSLTTTTVLFLPGGPTRLLLPWRFCFCCWPGRCPTMSFHVGEEMRALGKTPATSGAGVRPFPCMGSLVGDQHRALGEPLPTLRAWERPLTRVTPAVLGQIGTLGKTAATVRTTEGLFPSVGSAVPLKV